LAEQQGFWVINRQDKGISSVHLMARVR